MQLAAKTPADLTITPRDRRFGRRAKQARWWHGGDPVATAWHNALSITFPRGEAFFIESVRAFRDGAPPKLEAEIKAFTMQEVMHSREHVAFNKRVTEAGYDVSGLEKAVVDSLEITKGRPQILNLAVTMALEHYTAMLAQMMLKHPRYFAGVDAETKAMWQWHAIEEIEHKAVAYDTFLAVTRHMSGLRRWALRCQVMGLVSLQFWYSNFQRMADFFRQDRMNTPRTWLRVALYLLVKPGMMRRIFWDYLRFFGPGFHPWHRDDRTLIAAIESKLTLQPPAPAA